MRREPQCLGPSSVVALRARFPSRLCSGLWQVAVQQRQAVIEQEELSEVVLDDLRVLVLVLVLALVLALILVPGGHRIVQIIHQRMRIDPCLRVARDPNPIDVSI